MRHFIGLFCSLASLAYPVAAAEARPEKSVGELQRELAAGLPAEQLVREYLARIRRLNPRLHAVITINPQALEEARVSDSMRRHGATRGPLDGIPILIKDNIDVAGGMPTTAGSLALRENIPQRDAGLVTRLKQAGLVILGKANLSEWANFRSTHSTSGWSAVGGLTRNPYALDHSACGSSSGSAVAVAADLAPLAIGTETDGSITCPAAMNGIVGIKPTVGRVSRAGIIPISSAQDTAGPLARNVADAALLLQVISGTDPADPATVAADAHRVAYRDHWSVAALRGVRIGVVRFLNGFAPSTASVFEQSLNTLRAQGAVLIDVDAFDFGDLGALEQTILLTEFKSGLNVYLLQSPPAVMARSLDQLIAFDSAEPRELERFGQELFERAQATSLDQAAYVAAHRDAARRAGAQGLDRLLCENEVAALVAPTTGPAYLIDDMNAPRSPSAGKLSAIAGYPHVTVPMGNVAGLPVGLSFLGPAWSEARLLALAGAFEAAAHARRAPRLACRGCVVLWKQDHQNAKK